jgi:hypothetical protein
MGNAPLFGSTATIPTPPGFFGTTKVYLKPINRPCEMIVPRIISQILATGLVLAALVATMGHSQASFPARVGVRPLTEMTGTGTVALDKSVAAHGFLNVNIVDLLGPSGKNWTIYVGIAIYGSDTAQYVAFTFNLTDSGDGALVAKYGASVHSWVCNYCFQQSTLSASLDGKVILTVFINNNDTAAQNFEIKATPYYWS